jgi:hypothetical protein
MAECLEILAIVAVKQGDHEHAARLLGAAQGLWDALHVVRPQSDHAHVARHQVLDTLSRTLPVAVFNDAWQQGGEMNLDELVERAVQP